ncbi:MAG: GNAT family N-acetyltransferase [Crocinitomicaceae bacterium]|nr:GNAT family N-acetyltransferase [Crocinitomicaceae bacterium]
MMLIRKFNSSDKNALLEVLRSNTPKFFALSEEKDFNDYLEREIEDYFVVEEDGKILACGGINYFPKEEKARISWDMVDPKSQGKGIGGNLMEHRIQLLKNTADINFIEVRTSQHTSLFYEKMGFELVLVVKDYWAEGFDLYEMIKLNKN